MHWERLTAFLVQQQGQNKPFPFSFSILFWRLQRVNPGWRLHQPERVQRGKSSSSIRSAFPFSAPASGSGFAARSLVYSSLAIHRPPADAPNPRASSTFDGACRPLFANSACGPDATGPSALSNRLNCDRQLRNFQPRVSSAECRRTILTNDTALSALDRDKLIFIFKKPGFGQTQFLNNMQAGFFQGFQAKRE